MLRALVWIMHTARTGCTGTHSRTRIGTHTRAKRAHAYTHARAQARIMRTREAEKFLPYYRKKKMVFFKCYKSIAK